MKSFWQEGKGYCVLLVVMASTSYWRSYPILARRKHVRDRYLLFVYTRSVVYTRCTVTPVSGTKEGTITLRLWSWLPVLKKQSSSGVKEQVWCVIESGVQAPKAVTAFLSRICRFCWQICEQCCTKAALTACSVSALHVFDPQLSSSFGCGHSRAGGISFV